MVEIALGITIAIALGAGGLAYVLDRQRRKLATERDALQQQLTDSEAARVTLDRDLAVLQEKLAGDEQRLDEFKQQLDTHFKALSGDALKASRDDFLKQANERLKPITDLLKQYDTQYKQIEQSRKQEYGGLKQVTETLHAQTASLLGALRRPEVRGRWGEIALQRIVELAGLTERCDFDTQTSVKTEDGLRRPDLVVHLPNERTIVVDSKVNLDAFLDAAKLPEGDERAAKLEDHVRQVREVVQKLAAVGYQGQFDRSPDFVVMFIPVESALYAALEVDGALAEYAMSKGVVIATPTLLIALLKTVEMGWREAKVAESAAQIRDLGLELHERLAKALNDVLGVGTSLETAVKRYNTLVGSLGGRVMPSARKFEQLGVRSAEELPGDLPAVEVVPREVQLESERERKPS